MKYALIALSALAIPVHAQQQITLTPSTLQSGSPVLFRVSLPEATNVTGTWLKHDLAFTKLGDHMTWFVFAGVDVEQAPGTYPLDVTETLPDGKLQHIVRQIVIGPASYRTTTIQVEPNFLAPDKATQTRIAAEAAVKTAAFAINVPRPIWSGAFISPVHSTPTDSFGTRRTFNGTLASIHKGADFHAATGTPVLAANDGIVAFAQPMFYEGNVVALDHGQQFFTLYMHLSKIEVHTGDHVKKGQRLGLSGATGRVDGPHLHFGVRWQGAYLDPALLLDLPLPSTSSEASPAPPGYKSPAVPRTAGAPHPAAP